MTADAMRALLALFGLAVALASAQDPPARSPIPEHLRLRGDPAPDIDLGAARLLAIPLPAPREGPITEAAYLCQTCVRAGDQGAGESPSLERLLGRPASVIRPWLGRISETEPQILTRDRVTLVALLGPRRMDAVTSEERMRLMLFLRERAGTPRGRFTGHQRAHLWMERLVLLESALGELLALDPAGELRPLSDGMRPLAHPRAEIYLFDAAEACTGFVRHLFGPDAQPGDGLQTDDGPVAAVLVGSCGAEAGRRRFLHAGTLALLRRHRRLDGGIPPWLEIGLAHFMERRLHGAQERRDTAFTLPAGMESPPDWDQFVRDLAISGKSGSLDALTATPGRALSLRSRIQAWSMVKFLIGVDRTRFSLLLRRLLHAEPAAEPVPTFAAALKEAYAADPKQVEQAWKAWVLSGGR